MLLFSDGMHVRGVGAGAAAPGRPGRARRRADAVGPPRRPPVPRQLGRAGRRAGRRAVGRTGTPCRATAPAPRVPAAPRARRPRPADLLRRRLLPAGRAGRAGRDPVRATRPSRGARLRRPDRDAHAGARTCGAARRTRGWTCRCSPTRPPGSPSCACPRWRSGSTPSWPWTGAAAVVAGLADLVRAHPLRERAHLLHITALYRAGRRADALAAFRAAGDVFVTELGIEPGFELRALEASILAGEPTAATAPGPAQLPRDVPAFVGRDRRDVAGSTTSGRPARARPWSPARPASARPRSPIRWAHRNRDAFPDGQLYVDLHGFGPGRPVAPEDVLAGFLRALGVDGAAVPADPVERAARFRSLVHDRRLLVVLDNAQSAAQVRPLLAGGRSCFVVGHQPRLARRAGRPGRRRPRRRRTVARRPTRAGWSGT